MNIEKEVKVAAVAAEENMKKNMNELQLTSTAMEGKRDDSNFSPSVETKSENHNASISRKRSIRSITEMESIHKERTRRFKVTEMYSVLQSIVPNLRHKATRETIVTETIDYIKRLEEERVRLENLKKSIVLTESMAEKPSVSYFTNRNSSVNVSITGNVVFFGIQMAFRRRLVSNIIAVFEKHRADVMAANVSVNDQWQLTLSVTAVVGGYREGDVIEHIKREILML